jgi:phosphoribosylformylglycinamidine cyclo-ligase
MEENMENDFYKHSGVDTKQEESAMSKLLKWINPTFENRKQIGRNLLPIGFFANVLDIGNGLGLAISTDGVGTKILIAEMANKYDTIGIDCIAMNVNDLLCVGAEPISFVDYIAVGEIKPTQIEEIAKGLYQGALEAGVNIPGGELAQVKEIIHNSPTSFDIIGTAIGLVDTEQIITGKEIKEGDIVLGLASSGIHSNGLTLARKLLLNSQKEKETYVNELLVPTRIYCKEVLALKKQLNIKGLANITGEGFLNIIRLDAAVCYKIENLPKTPEIFLAMQEKGNIPEKEMYKDFNMGVGFVIIISKEDLPLAKKVLSQLNASYFELGKVEKANKPRIEILQKNIYSEGSFFSKIKE